jgi:hypothetical protein
MKLLIRICIFLGSVSAFAGVDGGGTGPRPGMGVFSFGSSGGGVGPRPGMDIFSAGGNSGSGGTRPDMGMFQMSAPVDFVKSIDFDRTGNIQFQYKGFEKPQVEVHAIKIQDISEKYLDALKRSQESRQWEPVEIEGLEN